MAFHDFRDPIEYVVNQFFERKRAAESNKTDSIEGKSVGQVIRNEELLPSSPFMILRDRNGKEYKFIYGEYEALREDPTADVFIWQQEIIRDEKGKTIAFETTFPDGYVVRESLVEENNKLKEIKVE